MLHIVNDTAVRQPVISDAGCIGIFSQEGNNSIQVDGFVTDRQALYFRDRDDSAEFRGRKHISSYF